MDIIVYEVISENTLVISEMDFLYRNKIDAETVQEKILKIEKEDLLKMRKFDNNFSEIYKDDWEYSELYKYWLHHQLDKKIAIIERIIK